MDLESGIFTAPRSGIYFFSFSGITHRSGAYVGLYVNNTYFGSGYGSSSADTFIVQSTLHLNAGDNVSVRIWGDGDLQDNSGHYTHFTGWLLQ